jgi:hypothetical protein
MGRGGKKSEGGMTEAEWLGCENPGKMLQFLQGKASERKLRLFACACCRRIWRQLTPARSRRGVETSERYADGLVGRKELLDAKSRAWEVVVGLQVRKLRSRLPLSPDVLRSPWFAAAYAADEVPARLCRAVSEAALWDEGRNGQLSLLHEVFGNPFRPVTIDRAWLSWNGTALRNIAQAIYDERAFDRLPILGDALEEAGCTSAELLAHCREPGEHVRGCWAVDLLLGKE